MAGARVGPVSKQVAFSCLTPGSHIRLVFFCIGAVGGTEVRKRIDAGLWNFTADASRTTGVDDGPVSCRWQKAPSDCWCILRAPAFSLTLNPKYRNTPFKNYGQHEPSIFKIPPPSPNPPSPTLPTRASAPRYHHSLPSIDHSSSVLTILGLPTLSEAFPRSCLAARPSR